MEESKILYMILPLVGAFCIAASIADWEFFFTNRRAKFFVNTFGRNGARIFYLILGLALGGLGIFKLI